MRLKWKKAYVKAFAISSIFQIIVSILFFSIGDKESLFSRFFLLLGGDFFRGGFFQFLIIFSSIWTFFDIHRQRRLMRIEKSGINLGLLSTNEKHVLLPKDLYGLEDKIKELPNTHRNLLLTRVLSAAISKFKGTHSMGETIDVISIQSDLRKEIQEAGQSNIRYFLWLIPSLGFMGTVVGLAQALGIAHEGDMKNISTALGLAFDTTLIALILGAIVTGFYHRLEEEMDLVHASIKEYIVNNFVNKLEIGQFKDS